MTKLLLDIMSKHVECVTSPLHKQVWKHVAASMNTHGYNLSAENCNIKWNGMKKKYKMLKDARNQSGAGKQAKWEYYDIINDVLRKQPEIAPLSIASGTRGFKVNYVALNASRNINETQFIDDVENEENLQLQATNLVESTNRVLNRVVRKRKNETPIWTRALMEQKQRHHEQNYAQRERLLSLLEKHFDQ
ncbi:hypothetical protein DMN91_004054 [Ooceraea biroi]|uniref:Myb/SANT-like DNA-binding domain-containing protein n=1 Tax=Ooceraea biroi TaxID=2015173 RepID=A0A026VWM6_OOCBI|nr:hypothetical protein X777_14398 [Ooceraea biroi]RLU23845.1 hypothetical protein DMN91_004053 [Ooceraea biroi]RLU23846.1 hypothetical protein DMN91_004054 [Ooceraea biroi]